LSLAYTPGVAEPCLEIEKRLLDVFRMTAIVEEIVRLTAFSVVDTKKWLV